MSQFQFQESAASASAVHPQPLSHPSTSPIILTPLPSASPPPSSLWSPLLSALSQAFFLLFHHFSIFFHQSFSRFYHSSSQLCCENPLLFLLLSLPVCATLYNYLSSFFFFFAFLCVIGWVSSVCNWQADVAAEKVRVKVGKMSKAAAKKAAAVAKQVAEVEKKKMREYRWEFSSGNAIFGSLTCTWYPFTSEHSEAIERVLRNGNEIVKCDGKYQMIMNGCSYVIDVLGMTQTNAATGTVRQLRRVRNSKEEIEIE